VGRWCGAGAAHSLALRQIWQACCLLPVFHHFALHLFTHSLTHSLSTSKPPRLLVDLPLPQQTTHLPTSTTTLTMAGMSPRPLATPHPLCAAPTDHFSLRFRVYRESVPNPSPSPTTPLTFARRAICRILLQSLRLEPRGARRTLRTSGPLVPKWEESQYRLGRRRGIGTIGSLTAARNIERAVDAHLRGLPAPGCSKHRSEASGKWETPQTTQEHGY
jgi:hypothetical protein